MHENGAGITNKETIDSKGKKPDIALDMTFFWRGFIIKS
jgi:hypothetical protein